MPSQLAFDYAIENIDSVPRTGVLPGKWIWDAALAFDEQPIKEAGTEFDKSMRSYVIHARDFACAIFKSSVKKGVPDSAGRMLAAAFARKGVRTDPEQIHRVLVEAVTNG